jgi:hypothetical protein
MPDHHSCLDNGCSTSVKHRTPMHRCDRCGRIALGFRLTRYRMPVICALCRHEEKHA